MEPEKLRLQHVHLLKNPRKLSLIMWSGGDAVCVGTQIVEESLLIIRPLHVDQEQWAYQSPVMDGMTNGLQRTAQSWLARH